MARNTYLVQFKKITGFILFAAIITFLWSGRVNAAEDEQVIIALGADLSDEQQDTVLSYMGIAKENLSNYKVVYISNEDEHKYLDQYLDNLVIGSNALTSVKMTKLEPGAGINISTQNINYCTTGMYRNALLTAGVEDCEFYIVAPQPVSGTAGLVGAISAYQLSSNEKIDDENIDVAMAEMITTGDIAEHLDNVDSEDVEALISWLKNRIASGKLDTSDEKSIKNSIKEGEKTFSVSLSDDDEDNLIKLIKRLDSLGLNGSYLISQAENLYEKYGSDIVNQTSEVIGEAVDEAVSQAGKSFIESIKESFRGLLGSIFKRK